MTAVTPERMREIYEKVKNWGRWGSEDQAGALNLLTPERRKAAAALVQSGVSVGCSREFPVHPGPENPHPALHMMVQARQSLRHGAPSALRLLARVAPVVLDERDDSRGLAPRPRVRGSQVQSAERRLVYPHQHVELEKRQFHALVHRERHGLDVAEHLVFTGRARGGADHLQRARVLVRGRARGVSVSRFLLILLGTHAARHPDAGGLRSHHRGRGVYRDVHQRTSASRALHRHRDAMPARLRLTGNETSI